MNRRDKDASFGLVNWPKDWKNTNEGGMVVYFAAAAVDMDINGHIPETELEQCCGASCVTLFYGEEIPSDSIRNFLFPDIDHADVLSENRYISRSLYAAVMVGNTGGSWWNEERQDYFECKYDDLTAEGKTLYRNLWDLYGFPPIIVTFLDT